MKILNLSLTKDLLSANLAATLTEISTIVLVVEAVLIDMVSEQLVE